LDHKSEWYALLLSGTSHVELLMSLMLPFATIFQEIAALLLLTAVMGALAAGMRQPLIVAFIAVGILSGPAGFNWLHSAEQVDLLAQIGITLLLFMVGLKLDLHLIRSMGRVALATGLGQVLFTSIIGYGLSIALGLEPLQALYVAVALTFSSTIIIVKLLSDKGEIDSLHGRIAIGFLIVQDIVVVLVMIGLSALGTGGEDMSLAQEMLMVFFKGAALLAGMGILMRYGLPQFLHYLARTPELMMLFAIAWGVFLAALSEVLGFSKEVGGFLAGMSLASTPYREAIGSRLVSIRDFLLLFFFLSLGSQLDMSHLGLQVWPAIVLSLFVLIGNPLIVIIIMGLMGYRARTGFLAGLTVAQISEFSLILGALGVSLGHIDDSVMGLITLVGLITIGLSTYLILYSHPLYERLGTWIQVFERKIPHREEEEDATSGEALHPDVILCGLGRYGSRMAEGLRQRGFVVLGVDFDPEVVAHWHTQGWPALYGDAADPNLPDSLPLDKTHWVVSTIPAISTNIALLHALRTHGYTKRLALAAFRVREAEELKQAGADVVLIPFADAAERAVELIHASPVPS
jgi:Kef-type K+ transport system membrane component KefB